MRILVVEDDSATASFMVMAFASAGHAVVTASTVGEAMDHVAADPPDVVLTDLTFGRGGDADTDGFSLLRWLRSRSETTHIGVLAVSGAGSPEVLRAVEDRGFDGFVSKPVDVASLIERVHRLGDVAANRRIGQSQVDSSERD